MPVSTRCWCSLLLFTIWSMAHSATAEALDLSVAFSAQNLMPKGEYYKATVPDTLDLSERAKVSIHGLTRFLNEKKNYSPYGHAFYNVQTPYMTTFFTGPNPCWAKILDAQLLTRLMSGSDQNLEIQSKSFLAILATKQNLNHDEYDARFLMVLMTLYQQNPDPKLKAAIDAYSTAIEKSLVSAGDMAYFKGWGPESKPDMKDAKYGVIGYGWQVFIQGAALRGLSRYSAMNGDAQTIDLCRKLKNYIIQPTYWFSEAAPKAVVGAEHGQFMGHHHSYTAALMGLLWYGQATGDPRVLQFVREGYEYMRTFGIARIGLFAEMCTTGDMLFLAVKLSELGVGDYWDDADGYLRNQIAETQILDTEKLRKAAEAEPILDRLNPHSKEDVIQPMTTDSLKRYDLNQNEETEDHVIDRTLGCFLSSSSNPTHIPKHQFLWTICCSGNVTPALYWAWDAAAQFSGGTAQVNLLLNRASPWIDVDSYLPYEGKVVIRNKAARRVQVLIPGWVDKHAVRCQLNDQGTSPSWVNRYLVVDGLAGKDVITVTFPMVETTETYTLKWKTEDFWLEGTNPGSEWKAPEHPDKFTFKLKGNTVIEVTPRYAGTEYALYQRDSFKQARAPMKEVERFVAPTLPRW